MMLSSPLTIPGHTQTSSSAVGGFHCSDINELECVRPEECTELDRADRIKQSFSPLQQFSVLHQREACPLLAGETTS